MTWPARMDTISVYFMWYVMCLEKSKLCIAVCYYSYSCESAEDWLRAKLQNPWVFKFLVQKWHSI